MSKAKQTILPFLISKEQLNAPSSVEETDSHNELLMKVIDETYSTKDIEVKTHLSDAQITAFSKGRLYAEKYKLPIIDGLIKHVSTYSVSKDRLSRKEFTEIAKAIHSQPTELYEEPIIRGRLLGKE